MARIYLDYNGSTPVARPVLEAMENFRRDHYGNSSANHWAAEGAKRAIEKARAQVARLINARPDEIIFTSSGSEANNLILKGTYLAAPDRSRARFITSAVEHPSVVEPLKYLKSEGAALTILPVNRTGHVRLGDVHRALEDGSTLISVMAANNEVGSIQPIGDIATAARKADVLVHTDAAQAVGKIPVDVRQLGVDALTIAGHKLYGPKGVGALYLRDGVRIVPLIHGGGHERGLRASTHATELIVGLGEACRIARAAVGDAAVARLSALRDKLFGEIQARYNAKMINNSGDEAVLPNTLNISFPGLVGNLILREVPDLAASTGSSCHSESDAPSGILVSMGLADDVARGAIRLSVGRETTNVEIVAAAEMISRAANHLLKRQS